MAEQTTSRDADDIEPDDMDAVAARLEVALERIARQLDDPGALAFAEAPAETPELAARLDGLIARLREALGHGATD
ncbi:MAG: hypothetical protein EXR07_11525 [Acetobacteraceae bacterium]|nr:hypothetical protein [Acetobacteraceae bacterium]